ncbi:hypothetical protein DER46DRAFT_569012 [Fusarium sp. MPI-SDFR-AT-0072]|uniref:Uncharacterized protein n=1 Tax=Fusarium oxysporum f. sp. rapae TaxID=485398 RepID=A0A8J5UBC0_FUSOX|nr:hypothetical protein Forpe1208_v005219 [Fusarium oxysporum f. sp. rapae]KAH7177343.1 hypothetical protein DER46DRAFT_569012 [Fusarium sp. MPI-SDFR-AT-0072]KAI7765819.1 hypothetical protein LZL87_000932 [Fusarium oxysporum]
MVSQSATPSAGSAQDANDDTFDSLRQRLHEAEHTITGLKAAQKATQEFILAQNAELKKENNQLREEMTVLRCQTSQAVNDGNEAIPGASVTLSLEDVKKLRGIIQDLKRHGSELHRQTRELRDCVLLKQEEFSRKRRRTDSDTDRNKEESPAMQFLNTCKRYNNQTTRASIGFKGPLEVFIEDLSRAQESRSSLPHDKMKKNLTDFIKSNNNHGWHCLREVCEKGKLSTEVKAFSVCPLHNSDCEFLILNQQLDPGSLGFASFARPGNFTK